jgi:pimeloyl-ACP methyl ester carboxylesterase
MSFVNVNGANIRYTQYGEDKHKHVLFIHGLGSSLIGWRDIPQALSPYVHTIAVDLIGFGGSDKPETADYEIQGLRKFIVDFITGLGIRKDEKLSLVGHSLGGYIAAEVAIANKDLIEKLVLIDPSGTLNGPTPLLRLYLAAAMETEPVLRYKKVQKVFENLLADGLRLSPITIDLFVETIVKEGALYAFKSAFDNSTTTQIGLERLRQIGDIPCLLIWGEQDNLIPIDYANDFQEVFRKENVDRFEKISDAGHAPFAEKTALVYEKILAFLAR